MSEHTEGGRWRWAKPVRWSDICRAQMMLNPDLTGNQIRKQLVEQIAAGNVIQIDRGLYRMAVAPKDV